jgi:DNA-binding Xre family transcriptional regulator
MSIDANYIYNIIMIKIKLHDLLWQMRISQKELAEGSGLAESTISKFIRGDYDCRLSTLQKICNYLQCKITDVIEFERD